MGGGDGSFRKKFLIPVAGKSNTAGFAKNAVMPWASVIGERRAASIYAPGLQDALYPVNKSSQNTVLSPRKPATVADATQEVRASLLSSITRG